MVKASDAWLYTCIIKYYYTKISQSWQYAGLNLHVQFGEIKPQILKKRWEKKYQFLGLQFCSKILLKSIYSSNNLYTVHIFFILKKTTIFRRILSILLYTEVSYIRFVLTTSTWKSKGWNNDGIILSFITCLPWTLLLISAIYAVHCL